MVRPVGRMEPGDYTILTEEKTDVHDVMALGDKCDRYVAGDGEPNIYLQTIIPDGLTIRAGHVVMETKGGPCDGVDMTADGDCIIPPDCFEVAVVFHVGESPVITTKAYILDKDLNITRDTASSE